LHDGYGRAPLSHRQASDDGDRLYGAPIDRERMHMKLHIRPSAAEFIRRRFESESTEMVLVVTEFVAGSLRELDGENWDKRPTQDLEKLARQRVGELPSKVMIEYAIGTTELSRVPAQYVRVIDGIKCCFPDELIEAIGERDIVFDKGVLRFEPPLESYELRRD